MIRMLALLAGLCVARSQLHAQPTEAGIRTRWTRVTEDGYRAPVWVHHVVAASAASAGYGALRFAGIQPTPAAAAVVGAGLALHVRGWARGEYRPSADWLFDGVVRGGPAVALAVCERRGRPACALALATLAGAYLATLRYASP